MFQNERSIEFTYILEAMSFLSQLVNASSDLSEEPQFEYITQTVGNHLENYLKYNRREKNDLELILATQKKHLTGGSQKHMEIMSLHVLIYLREKSHDLCMRAIM